MVIVACKLRLHLPASQSLKAKRGVITSMVGRVRSHFDVAVAETGEHDLWQLCEIGVACISTDARHGDEVIAHVVDFIAGLRPGEAELLDYETAVLQPF